MNISEKKLLDNYTGVTNAGNFISEIDGKTYHWNYAWHSYTWDDFSLVENRDEANIIKCTMYGHSGKYVNLGAKCMNRAAYNRAIADWKKAMEV